MVWIALAMGIVAFLVTAATVLAKRRPADMGSVSAHWIAQHRID